MIILLLICYSSHISLVHITFITFTQQKTHFFYLLQWKKKIETFIFKIIILGSQKIAKMYMGKGAMKAKKEAKQKKSQMVRLQTEKNAQKIKHLYANFQDNLNAFAKNHKKQINSDSKFRDKFTQMCLEFDVNPMLAEKNIWTELGLGDFYHHLAMKVLDICARNRHQNGGLMKIDEILQVYRKKDKTDISRNDIIRSVQSIGLLGNASIVNKQYICTVPLQLNQNLTQLLAVSEKYGFISAKLMKSQKNWTEEDFETRTMDIRKKGIVWVDKKVPHGHHYYFLNQLGTDFKQFAEFMKKY